MSVEDKRKKVISDFREAFNKWYTSLVEAKKEDFLTPEVSIIKERELMYKMKQAFTDMVVTFEER